MSATAHRIGVIEGFAAVHHAVTVGIHIQGARVAVVVMITLAKLSSGLSFGSVNPKVTWSGTHSRCLQWL